MIFSIPPDNDGYVTTFFLAISALDETLSNVGERIGRYEITLEFHSVGYSSKRFKADRSDWNFDAWSIHDSIPYCHPSASQVWGIKWWIEKRPEDVPTSVTRTLKNPVDFESMMADLFDDEESSTVVFIMSNPRRHSDHEEYIYAHTKILSNRAEIGADVSIVFQSGFAEGTTALGGATSQGDDLGTRELMSFDDSDYEYDDDSQPDKITAAEPGNTVARVSQKSKGKVVRITDTAYATYRAMLYYLYTGRYSFTPLWSSCGVQNPSAKSRAVSSHGLTNVPSSSAKSMYRLCHRLEIPKLKTAALKHIEKSLTPKNITAEICSGFTSRFPEIQEIEKKYLKSQWNNVKNTPAFKELIAKVFQDHPVGVGDIWLEVLRSS